MSKPASDYHHADSTGGNTWRTVRLRDICTIDKQQGMHTNLPYVGLEDIESSTGRFIGSLENRTAQSSTFRFTGQHVLYGRLRPYLNKTMAPDFEGHCSTEIFPLLPRAGLNRRFLQYWLMQQRIVDLFNQTCTGARMPRANVEAALCFPLRVPSDQEQQRIVAILDDAFDGIATAKRNAKRNLDNASALFAAARSGHLMKAVLKLKGQSLGDVAEVQSGGTPLISTKSYWSGDIAWYSSGELNNTYTEAPKRCISQQGLDRSNAKIFPQGSLLIGMYDTAALKMSLLDRDASFNQAIAGVKPNDSLEPLFVLHTINSQRNNILSGRRGTRQKNLSLGKIKEITIRVPPIAVQRRVVESIEQDVAVSENLAAIYRRKIELLEDLKQSLLDQAFSR